MPSREIDPTAIERQFGLAGRPSVLLNLGEVFIDDGILFKSFLQHLSFLLNKDFSDFYSLNKIGQHYPKHVFFFTLSI